MDGPVKPATCFCLLYFRSEEQLSDQSDHSDFKSPRDQKRKTKSQKVRLKDGTVVDLTPPEKLLKKAEAKAKFLETKNKVKLPSKVPF